MIPWLWWSLSGAVAAPIALCTDRGPLVAEVTPDGVIRGSIGDQRVDGTLDSLRVVAGGDVLFRGPLTALNPRPSTSHPEPHVAAAAVAAAVGATAEGVAVMGGGFEGRVGADGIVRGLRGGASEVWALDIDGAAFGGPLASDAPLIDLVRQHGGGRPGATVRVAADHLREVGALLDCGRGGVDGVALGVWGERVEVPAGWSVTDGRTDDVLLRDPDGAPVWLLAIPCDRSFAEHLMHQLQALYPDLSPAVAWSRGAALVTLGRSRRWKPPPSVTPVAGGPAVGALIDPHPAVRFDTRAPGVPGYAVLESGREMVALMNHHRSTMGLQPLEWDAPLALAAALHAAWLEPGTTPDGHRQEPGEPRFVGERPVDRGGASEVVHRSVGAGAWQSVDAWIGAPFHRIWPLHPHARAGGAIGLWRARVAEIRVEASDDVPTVAFPPEGSVAPGLAFAGRESPDPLPLFRYPDRVWPVGYPVSVWVPLGTRILDASLSVDGEAVPAWGVTAGPSAPRDAVHIIPKEPLSADAQVQWSLKVRSDHGTAKHTGQFRTPPSAGTTAVSPVGAAARAIELANARRIEAGGESLEVTDASQGLARWVGTRTRAIDGGLPAERVRQRIPDVRGRILGGAQRLCIRPGDAFDVDETWLDPRIRAAGVEEGATTVTWSNDPTTGQASMRTASPRTCVLLYGDDG